MNQEIDVVEFTPAARELFDKWLAEGIPMEWIHRVMEEVSKLRANPAVEGEIRIVGDKTAEMYNALYSK